MNARDEAILSRAFSLHITAIFRSPLSGFPRRRDSNNNSGELPSSGGLESAVFNSDSGIMCAANKAGIRVAHQPRCAPTEIRRSRGFTPRRKSMKKRLHKRLATHYKSRL